MSYAVRTVMRIVVCALVLAPSLAAAGPISAGVSAGAIQSQVDAGTDPNHMLGLFGRFGFTPRFAGQLELQKIETTNENAIRTLGALAVFDLGRDPHFVPTLVAGLGYDREDPRYGAATTGHHFEAGLGLEYRSDAGFVVGVEARIGTRSIDSESKIVPLSGSGGVIFDAPTGFLHEGEYRLLRATAGVRF